MCPGRGGCAQGSVARGRNRRAGGRTSPRARDGGDPHDRAGVADRVVDHVAEQPGQLGGVPGHRQRGRDVGLDPYPGVGGRRPDLGQQRGQQGGGFHAPASGRGVGGVRAGQEKQLADQALQPGRLPDGALGDGRPGGPVRVGQPDLQAGADRGQRAAQLVAGVGDEAALPPGGVLQPGQHRVHGLGQVADLVVGPGLRDPPGEVGGGQVGDVGDGAADVLHRAQGPADDQPDRRAGQEQHRRQPDEQQPGEGLVDLPAQRRGGSGDDRDRPAAGRRVFAVDDDLARDHAVGGLLPDRGRGPGRQGVDRGEPGQLPGGREHPAVGGQDLCLRGGVEAGGRQRVRERAVGCGRLLDLGGVGTQLTPDGAPGRVHLEQVHHDDPEHHGGGQGQPRHGGDPGAHGARPEPSPSGRPVRRAHRCSLTT